jgi:hypothetical protein
MDESESVRGPGRPTKLTEQVEAAICEAVELGCSYKTAAEAAGINVGTLHRWRNENCDFDDALLKSKTRGIRTALERIRKAAEDPKFWCAAAWFLERVCPESFGRKQEVKIEKAEIMTDADIEEARKENL